MPAWAHICRYDCASWTISKEAFPGKMVVEEKRCIKTNLTRTSLDSSTWHSRTKFRVSEWGLQLLPQQLHTQMSRRHCHLCNTKHTMLGYTLAILWLTHPCGTFDTIIDLYYKERSSLSLSLTFHELSSCQHEAGSWWHCLKWFKFVMFKLEITEFWVVEFFHNQQWLVADLVKTDWHITCINLVCVTRVSLDITRRLSYQCWEYLGVALELCFVF